MNLKMVLEEGEWTPGHLLAEAFFFVPVINRFGVAFRPKMVGQPYIADYGMVKGHIPSLFLQVAK